jgi:hypothetical protein
MRHGRRLNRSTGICPEDAASTHARVQQVSDTTLQGVEAAKVISSDTVQYSKPSSVAGFASRTYSGESAMNPGAGSLRVCADIVRWCWHHQSDFIQ